MDNHIGDGVHHIVGIELEPADSLHLVEEPLGGFRRRYLTPSEQFVRHCAAIGEGQRSLPLPHESAVLVLGDLGERAGARGASADVVFLESLGEPLHGRLLRALVGTFKAER